MFYYVKVRILYINIKEQLFLGLGFIYYVIIVICIL
jgi:hypothetical protein